MEILIIKISLVIIFSLAIIGKLTGKTKSTFEKAGFSKVIMYLVAIAEVIFITMLFTKYEVIAALALLAIMLTALLILLNQNARPAKYFLTFFTIILLTLLLILIVR